MILFDFVYIYTLKEYYERSERTAKNELTVPYFAHDSFIERMNQILLLNLEDIRIKSRSTR